MARGPVNRHRGLRDGDLPRRYLRRHDRVELDDVEHDYMLEVDDYWNPWSEATSLDFQLVRIWHDVVTIGYAPSIGLPDSITRESPARSRQPIAPEAVAPEAIVDALFTHLQRVTSLATLDEYLESAQRADALDQVRVAGRRFPALLRWFEQRRGPGVILILLAPFWIRSLEDWSAPGTDDIDTTGQSVIEFLLLRYPIPGSLYQPWRSARFPSLKWVSWLLLFGQGASLRRAAARFGWTVSSRLVQHFRMAPADLEPIGALMWAEIQRLGGSRIELDRVLRHPAYLFDPTASTSESELAFEDDQRGDRDNPERHRAFWQSTVGWLVRHRDELTDEDSEVILDWAMHRHTEDLARARADADRFSWRGRPPARALEQAREYRRRIGTAWWHGAPIQWPPRGWDWEERADNGSWSVRELTSGSQLAAESEAMRHCVASYVFRCVQGRSSIFSVSFAGERRFTLEVEPVTRRIVQARGKHNRECHAEELGVMNRWLDRVMKGTLDQSEAP